MCGIAGLMMRDGRPVSVPALNRLAAALRHRGPDGNGRHVDGSVGTVSTRLAIIDLKTGDQPIAEPQGAVLVANGEIYNDPELRARLTDVRFRTGSDCESPLHLYRRKGIDFVDDLRGMYAIAIYDPTESRLVLARDTFGIKPLYYVETAAFLAFASEPQALIRAGLAGREIRRHERAELLQLKFTTGSQTIFADIQRVLPGETIVASHGQIVERRRRKALPRGGPVTVRHDVALKRLEEVLTESVRLHMRSDVPYGLFLSGGIDSSVLVALMARLSARPVVAFTVSFPKSRVADEREAAEQVARAVGAEHHVIEMTEGDFWRSAPQVAAALDDPTTDAATIPTFALAEAAKANLKVVLSGEGADEIFAGYGRYRRTRWLWGVLARKAHQRGEFDGLTSMNGALAGWRDGLDRMEADEVAADWSQLQRMQAVDCAEWLPNDLLTKMDRCLMAHSVEGRTPFVDPVVGEFAFRLPDDLKTSGRLGKLILREWLAKNVPGALPYAKKKGFNPPIADWIAAKGDIIRKLVASQPGIAALASEDEVGKVFADPERNRQAAWSLLFYALWHTHHVMQVSPAGTIQEVLDAAAHSG